MGKITVINALYHSNTNYFDNLPGDEKDKIVVLCSPTGNAAFLINGTTLHTVFACSQFSGNMSELSSDIANSIREKLFHLKLPIIDEISMVGSTLLSRVETRLRQILRKNELFGGIPVIVVGDLHQLPPVMDSPIYRFVKNQLSSIMDRIPLWDNFVCYEITEVMRQKEDLDFVNTLKNIEGTVTARDIDLINTRSFKPDKIKDSAIR